MSDSVIDRVATIFPVDLEELKGEGRFARRRSIVREFALNTSTHAIPRIASAQTKHNRLFWTVCLLIFTGIMLYFIITSFQEYFKYPTQTLVSLVEDSSQSFAAVTICSFSWIRFDRFMEPFTKYTNERNLTDTNDTSVLTREQLQYIPEFFIDYVNRNQSVREFLYPMEELLIRCTYNSLNCTAADFVQFEASGHGLCHTFNGKADHIRNGSLYSATDNGEDGQLTLQLYSRSQPNVSGSLDGRVFLFSTRARLDALLLCLGIGFKVVLHDNRELPIIATKAMFMGGGRIYRLGYSKKVHHALGPPYTSCTDHTPPMLQAAFDKISGIDYAHGGYICSLVCYQVYM